MEQRALKLDNGRVVYCYADGSVEFLCNMGKRPCLRRTFGWDNSTGYLGVRLGGKYYFVHRLIAAAFIQIRINNQKWIISTVTRKITDRIIFAG